MKNRNFDIAAQGQWDWTINGNPADEYTNECLNEEFSVSYGTFSPSVCRYCHTPMTSQSFNDVSDDDEEWHKDRIYLAQTCPRCAHWEFAGNEVGNRCMDAPEIVLLSSISARFEGILPDGCSIELAQHLRRNPQKWHELNPRRFEKLVADVFRANYADSEVIHVGGPGDRGVDVIFVDGNKTRWLIQAKRRANPRKAERFSTLQSILGTLVLEREKHGMIVSTSNTLSRQAKVGVRDAEDEGFIVKTIDKGVLDRMVGARLPSAPWREIFELSELSHVGDDIRKQFCDTNQLQLFGSSGT